MKQLLSPKQVATSIGVSESSLKRWCDQGVLITERTPGGHRRIRIGEVIRFLREQHQPLVRPEVLGLPVGSGQRQGSTEKACESLYEALRDGDQEQARRIVIDSYLSGATIIQVCEDLLTPTLHAIGDGWECGRIEVYQERRACELVSRLLYELRLALPVPSATAPLAIGGSPSGDDYRLATQMVELVLVSDGWNAISLGSSLPFPTLASAVRHHSPALFWLSFSHVRDLDLFRTEFDEFLDSIPKQTQVVVGGREAKTLLGDGADFGPVFYGADLAELREIAEQVRRDDPANGPGRGC